MHFFCKIEIEEQTWRRKRIFIISEEDDDKQREMTGGKKEREVMPELSSEKQTFSHKSLTMLTLRIIVDQSKSLTSTLFLDIRFKA